MRRLPAWLLVTLLVLPACAEPPTKELNQAQGALDAARAAGAEQYAPDEYRAAAAALKSANDAVEQRDYRLALNNALDSRERAQNAAREAAITRARVRSEVERAMSQIAAMLAQASTRVAAAEKGKGPRRNLHEAQQLLARVNADVQKTGEAMKADDYMAAQAALNGIRDRIQQVISMLEPAAASQSSRRKG
jgi:Domain of unknown function (DUF4398)